MELENATPVRRSRVFTRVSHFRIRNRRNRNRRFAAGMAILKNIRNHFQQIETDQQADDRVLSSVVDSVKILFFESPDDLFLLPDKKRPNLTALFLRAIGVTAFHA